MIIFSFKFVVYHRFWIVPYTSTKTLLTFNNHKPAPQATQLQSRIKTIVSLPMRWCVTLGLTPEHPEAVPQLLLVM